MIRTGILGASGYTGSELIRIILDHPEFELTYVSANKYVGEKVSNLYLSFAGLVNLEYEKLDASRIDLLCDIVFVCLPHGESMKHIPDILDMGKKVVDLSADFRLKEAESYRKWYGVDHACPAFLDEAVYGLPEINREKITKARLVANPGCYPTAAILGLMPLVVKNLVSGRIVIDAKSGVSGAGRKTTLATHFPQAAENMSPYSVGKHRHTPEIENVLSELSNGKSADIVFVPHLTPMNRGILCTMYVPVGDMRTSGELFEIYRDAYANEPFVEILPAGVYPETKAVQGSNMCHISAEMIEGGKIAVIMSAIDNLVKGASGQAVQNMNLMCGIPENAGLGRSGLFP